MFDFRQPTVSFWGLRFSKHKMTRYAKNWGWVRPPAPGYAAYGWLFK